MLSRRLATARRAFAAAMTVAAVALSACSKDSSGPDNGGGGEPPPPPPTQSIVGTYALQSAADKALPAVIYEEKEGEEVLVRVSILSGSLTLKQDGKFEGTLNVRWFFEGEGEDDTPIPASGTYTRNGNTLTFVSDDPEDPQFTGTVSGGVANLTIDLLGIEDPISYKFKK